MVPFHSCLNTLQIHEWWQYFWENLNSNKSDKFTGAKSIIYLNAVNKAPLCWLSFYQKWAMSWKTALFYLLTPFQSFVISQKKCTSVSQKWSHNNYDCHLPCCSDCDWCSVINFAPAKRTTGRNVWKISKRKWIVWFIVILHRFPSQQHWVLSGESEEKRIKHADVSSSNSLCSSKKTK